MRLLIFAALLLAFDFYAFQAVRTLTQSWQPLLRNLAYGLHWLVPLAFLAWLSASAADWTDDWSKSAQTLIRTFFFIAYISKLLVVGVLLVDDLRRAGAFLYHKASGTNAFDPSRNRFLAQLGLALGAVPFFSLLYGIVRNPYRYRLFKEKVKLPDLPTALEGLKIVQISDIHTGSFLHKEPVENAVKLINQQEPDLVFFTGDLVNNRAEEAQPFVDIFEKIRAKYGVYSVLGNHDYGDYVDWEREEDKQANIELLKRTHRRLGWELLLNEHRKLDIKGEEVAVIGVENYSAHPRFPKYGDLKVAHEGAEQASLRLLLSHDPSHWEEEIVREFKNIALTFSGHTHGMQFGVEIPGWFKWSPIKYVYKQWAGLYKRGQQYLYVNRGLGYLGYPGRVGILPEVTLIELSRG